MNKSNWKDYLIDADDAIQCSKMYLERVELINRNLLLNYFNVEKRGEFLRILSEFHNIRVNVEMENDNIHQLITQIKEIEKNFKRLNYELHHNKVLRK